MRLSRDALRFGLFRTSTVVHWCGWLDFLSSLLICSVVRSFVRLYGQSIGDWSINPSTIQWSLMIKTTRVHTHTYKQNGTHTSFDLYYWLFPNSFWNATLSSVHFDGPVEVSPVEICLLALWVLHSKFSCGTLTRWLFSSAIHLMWWAHAAPPGPILWGNVPSRNSFTRVQLERICFCVPAALLWLVALSWSTRKSVCVCVCSHLWEIECNSSPTSFASPSWHARSFFFPSPPNRSSPGSLLESHLASFPSLLGRDDRCKMFITISSAFGTICPLGLIRKIFHHGVRRLNQN